MQMNLFEISWLMFAAGASGGALLAILGRAKKRYPRWLAIGHGMLGLAACGVLATAIFVGDGSGDRRARVALALLIATLVGGATLFGWLGIRRFRLPLALGHGAVAVTGLYLLYGAAFGSAT